MKRRLLLGTVGAIAGALLGAIAWGAITAATHFQIGYMAVGVGFLAGYGMRTLGGGRDRADGFIAGAVAFLGCVLGNLLTVIIEFAPQDRTHRGIIELTLLVLTNPKLAWILLTQSFSVMDLLFYGLAVYAGYRTALKPPALAETAAEPTPPATKQPDGTFAPCRSARAEMQGRAVALLTRSGILPAIDRDDVIGFWLQRTDHGRRVHVPPAAAGRYRRHGVRGESTGIQRHRADDAVR